MILSQIQGLQNNIFKRRDLSYYLKVLVAGCRLLVTGCWLLVGQCLNNVDLFIT